MIPTMHISQELNLVQFNYKNHRGKVEVRHVLPIRIWFGSTAWHPEPQWLMEAFDLDKQGTRDFALCGILGNICQYAPLVTSP